jgi:hypothetical protein
LAASASAAFCFLELALALLGLKGSGRHGADATRLHGLDTQHDPCRASALVRGTDDNHDGPPRRAAIITISPPILSAITGNSAAQRTVQRT